jgi:hypothetical protein
MYERIIKVELTSHTLYKGFENQLAYRLSGLHGSLEIMSIHRCMMKIAIFMTKLSLVKTGCVFNVFSKSLKMYKCIKILSNSRHK